MSIRLAVLSDVHGNCLALLKVLEDAAKRGIDRYIIAGDYCLSGAWPDACIQTLKELPGACIIRGNEERYLENLIGKDQRTWTDGQMQISYWNYRNIQKENLEYILSLPQVTEFEAGGVKIHVAHSSEQFLGAYEFGKFGPAILAERYGETEVTPKILQKDIQEILEQVPEFQEKLVALEEGVYIFGHSHVQWKYQAKDRNVVLINPGSCGLPLDAIRDSIPYSIMTVLDDATVEVEEIRISFNKAAYVEELKKTTQYNEARVWTEVIIRELLTAREHLTFFLQFVNEYAKSIGDARRPFSVETWEQAYEAWKQGGNHVLRT